MKTYHVHFSFYSEEYGNFDEAVYTVNAENQFEARREAWLLLDHDDDMRFASCVRQCGVTWEASPLDLQDYFNAQAAADKHSLRLIDRVELPNALIQQNDDAKERAKANRGYYLGSLEATRYIARGLYGALGIEPPDVFEEMEYAWLLVGKLDEARKHDKAQALADMIDRAKTWDTGAGCNLKELFNSGFITLAGETAFFTEHFDKNGVYPERADMNESDYTYTSRWRRAPSVGRLSVLPPFDGRHVIDGSLDMMAFNYRTLVLHFNELSPEQILWTPCEDADEINFDCGEPFPAENLITGARASFRRGDFCGVLRPEFAANIDFEALKREYAAANAAEDENADEDECGLEQEGA